MQETDTLNEFLMSERAVEAIIRAEKVEKYYAQSNANRIQVIAPTDLSIVPGGILALLGPSGSGGSIMLRMLTGLSTPSAGQVYWHATPIARAEVNVSIVFQSFALFPWLTVLENVEAPLQARGERPEERRERSLRMLDMVGLDGFEGAYPKELSGGMKQRVGFARALVVEPEVLFKDEPFSALDVLTAENLRSELLELWAKKTMPTKAVFIVTHNIEEAVLLAAQIDAATDSGRFPMLLLATIFISLMVVTMNRLVWRRLYRLAETRYKLEGWYRDRSQERDLGHPNSWARLRNQSVTAPGIGDERLISVVIANPEPKESIWPFDGEIAIVEGYARRPKLISVAISDFLELQRGMRRGFL